MMAANNPERDSAEAQSKSDYSAMGRENENDAILHNETPLDEPRKDSHLRSVVKALTWRLVATFSTIVITLFIIGDVRTAFHVGLFEFLAKLLPELVLFYAHERTWLRIAQLR